MISTIQQYVHASDGSISLKGAPHITLDTIAEQGHVTARDIRHELGLPIYYEEWAELAKHTGMSNRMFRCVLVDESPSRLPGNPRLSPAEIVPTPCYLEFGHQGFIVGQVAAFYFVPKNGRSLLQRMGIEVPSYVEGDCLIADAQLFCSPLADKAWEAIERGIFTHVCVVVFRQNSQALGTGQLVEVTLTTDDFPGCQNAKILKTWGGAAE